MKETVSVSLVQTLIQNCWKWTAHTVLITAFLVVIKLVILSALNKCKGLHLDYGLLLKKTMLKSFLFPPVWSIKYSYCLHLNCQKYTWIIQGTASWILCYSDFFFEACCSVNTWLRHPEGRLCNSHLLLLHQSHRAVLYRTTNFRHFLVLMQRGKGPGSIKWPHCFCSLKGGCAKTEFLRSHGTSSFAWTEKLRRSSSTFSYPKI